MIPPLLLWLASAVLRLVNAIAQPRVAQCPRGWYLHGVRPSGASECILVVDTPERCHGAGRCEPAEGTNDARLPLRIWCGDGELAVVRDHRTATCRKEPRP